MSNVSRDLLARDATAPELSAAEGPDFSYDAYVQAAIIGDESERGIRRFLSDLLDLEAIKPAPDDSAEAIAMVGDLREEPIQLVLRNQDKPWRWFFETKDILCTNRTAKIYGLTVDTSAEGFVACTLPPERAGILSLASFLRASPSAVYWVNNNYNRAAKVLYLASGVSLFGDPLREPGEAGGVPLLACMPTTDDRSDLKGFPMGAASVARYGRVCAGCHSAHLGPLSIAFRPFGPKGEVIAPETLPFIPFTPEVVLNDVPQVEGLLAETNSCWDNGANGGATAFTGVSELGRVVAESPNLGRALGVQLPPLLARRRPTSAATAAIVSGFEGGGRTLRAAIKSYLLSSSYRCRSDDPRGTETIVADRADLTITCNADALLTFKEELEPAIDDTCFGCHSKGSGGLVLRRDYPQDNRLALLRFTALDHNLLVEKIKSSSSHGGGDQSKNLPTDRIKRWIDAERFCDFSN